jgi:voltage-dependent calcium channel T type alpha-1G
MKLFKKNDLLEIIVQTMYRSLKPITITLILTFSFIFMYGLIGVNLFRGAYNYCEQPKTSNISIVNVDTKFDCLNMGALWVKPPRNFDNIFSAMLTLFEMMSSEDWLTPAYMGIDYTGIDL